MSEITIALDAGHGGQRLRALFIKAVKKKTIHCG